ncbi:hypothetical protein [Silvimonas iriomotensis]|uniref:Uncharacterized protein n=1 Tax=Silvimonas iriomotensis TaxID=449662 RepID=A0ABQ2P5S1_9NEIS|nr:hypothetical protein [Silvimonas iriomotensis]GGP18929.1 hypothetical protein GCM10010970_08090 [Silvimonas iriomotensis]
MFNSVVLETITGIVACFAMVALLTSSINEALASFLGRRANELFHGLGRVLNAHLDAPAADGKKTSADILLGLYNHALVNPRGDGRAKGLADIHIKPSYIEPLQFADALLELVQQLPGETLSAKVENGIADPQLKAFLLGVATRTQSETAKVRDELVRWFNNSMDRISGDYKRKVQLWTFVIALAVAVFFNIDFFHLFKSLWQHPLSAEQYQLIADAQQKPLGDVLDALPLGWPDRFPSSDTTPDWLIRILGWMVTATSALFGAPFWFDLLGRVTRLKGAGEQPGAKAEAPGNSG